MNKKIVIWSAVILIVVIVGFVWWRGMPAPAPKYTGPIEKITVANTEKFPSLVLIAEKNGYFSDNGLEVTTLEYPSGKVAADEMLAGKADISISAEFAFVSNSFTNPDLKILGTVDSLDNIEVIARKDHGITKPGDLKGKKIGVTKKSSNEFFLGPFLTLNNLSLADVEMIDLTPKEMADALLRGDVDAVTTWPPHVNNIKRELGDKAISWPGQNGQRYYMLLLAKEKFTNDKPEAIRRFLKSIVQAEDFVKNHDEIAKNIIAEKYHYDSAYINSVWPTHNFVVGLNQDLILLVESEARWRITNKLTDATTVLNFLNFVYFDALEAVKPEAISIIY